MRSRTKTLATLAVAAALIALVLWLARPPAPVTVAPSHLPHIGDGTATATPASSDDAAPNVPLAETTPPSLATTAAIASSASSADTPATSASPANPPPTAVDATIAEAVIANNEAEVSATRRMYGAHAPLRTPEVADPDSEANRRTLQTMVEKALSRAAESAAEPR